ncbi:transposase, partial [Escherichia coli M056]
PYGEVLRVPESGETALTGRGDICHNGDGEKNGETNHMERDVSAVTEGGPAEVRAVRESDAVYGAEEGLPSGRAGCDA